jgi:hypothetical protein
MTAALLLLVTGSPVAMAVDSAPLAEMAGFLLGNAHRCGVTGERVEHAGNVIQRLIVASSDDPTEEAAANSRFVEIFMATAFPDQDGEPLIPACKVVIAQFERLESHHQQAGMN